MYIIVYINKHAQFYLPSFLRSPSQYPNYPRESASSQFWEEKLFLLLSCIRLQTTVVVTI